LPVFLINALSVDSGYIPNVLRLIREHRFLFLGGGLAGLALRLFFVFYFPAITDDSRIYADLATNWLHHGVYGQTQGGQLQRPPLPTDARLPGYPAFLAGIFWLFGDGNFRAVMLAQVLIDIATCFVVADLALRMVSARAAWIAFVMAALCPFLANYSAAVLTETLEVFFTALALDCGAAALGSIQLEGGRVFWIWAATGASIAACVLLRPDGGILLAGMALYLLYLAVAGAEGGAESLGGVTSAAKAASEGGRIIAVVNRCATQKPMAEQGRGFFRKSLFRRWLVAGIIVVVVALVPLAPWTIRNFLTLHHFQPLAPRYANETDELVPRGFNRWAKTWMADYVSVQEIFWNVPGDTIDPQKLPARAFDNSAEREATLAAIAEYNESQDIDPELDARFGALAADRIRAHPLRYYVVLPVLRVADMWLRPRTELLPADPRWWEFHDERKESVVAVGFGLLNLAYVGTALWALVFGRSGIRWAGLLIVFLLLRSAFLGTLENPEPRYTLEGFPAVIVLASAALAGIRGLPRTADPALRSG
jgi:hypothetical protein